MMKTSTKKFLVKQAWSEASFRFHKMDFKCRAPIARAQASAGVNTAVTQQGLRNRCSIERARARTRTIGANLLRRHALRRSFGRPPERLPDAASCFKATWIRAVNSSL